MCVRFRFRVKVKVNVGIVVDLQDRERVRIMLNDNFMAKFCLGLELQFELVLVQEF